MAFLKKKSLFLVCTRNFLFFPRYRDSGTTLGTFRLIPHDDAMGGEQGANYHSPNGQIHSCVAYMLLFIF